MCSQRAKAETAFERIVREGEMYVRLSPRRGYQRGATISAERLSVRSDYQHGATISEERLSHYPSMGSGYHVIS